MTGPRPATPPGFAFSAILAFALGAVLVGLAAPRLLAAVAGLPARPVITELRAGMTLDPHFLGIAAKSQAASLGWVESGRGWAELGLIKFVLARRDGFSSDDAKALVTESISAHRDGLSLSPAQSYVWARLAHIELLRTGPTRRLGPLLALSMITAPYEYKLVFFRLELCFLVWRQLDNRVRSLVAEQIRFAATYRVKRLAELAKQRYALGMVRAALVDVPELRRRFDAAYIRL